MARQKKPVYVAMSGGVDSSVAAALLVERGFDVIGVHIKMWSDPEIPCNFKEDRYDALAAAKKIGIPFQTWDFTEEYRSAVVEYMIREYALGRTPNPDVMCNRHVKFGVFLKRALEQGADYVATGHHIQLGGAQTPPQITAGGKMPRPAANRCQLLRAKDENKDQSYFLWTLTQEQLRHCLFPIGGCTKPEVREMARERGLPTAEKKDSQGICFIGEIDLNAFLKKYIPEQRGVVMTGAGKRVGEHDGLSFYTIGQREGLGTGGGGIPYYVTGKDFQTNTLVVAEGPYDEKLFTKEVSAADVNWISGAPPKLPLKCEARIRYRQTLQSCTVRKSENQITVTFHEPQRAATPGQSIVFYQGDEMLGGGIITDSLPSFAKQ